MLVAYYIPNNDGRWLMGIGKYDCPYCGKSLRVQSEKYLKSTRVCERGKKNHRMLEEVRRRAPSQLTKRLYIIMEDTPLARLAGRFKAEELASLPENSTKSTS